MKYATKRTPKKANVSEMPPATPETRAEKLVRLAEKRITKAVNTIRLIGNLAAYKPTDPQVDKMMEALGEACARVDARLRGTRKADEKFSLSA